MLVKFSLVAIIEMAHMHLLLKYAYFGSDQFISSMKMVVAINLY